MFEALDARIGPQLADFEVGKATDAPRVQAVRRIPGLERAYMPDNTQAEIAEMRKIARSPAIEPAITGSYQELIKPKLVGGSMKLSFPNRLVGARSLYSALPVVGVAFGIEDAARRTAKAAKTKDPADVVQAKLAVAGNIPAVGNLADLANFGIDTFRAGPRMEPAVRNGSVYLPVLNR